MHDPFPIPPIPWLSTAVQPIARFFNLPTLPLHVHQVLISFAFYHWVNVWFAPRASSYLFPQKYNALSAEKKLNWNVHVVSLAQSTTINLLAIYVMLHDEERKNMTAQERVFGYTGGAGMIQGLAAGYFLWDLFVTVQHVKMFGIGMLAHAMSAFLVFSFGFRPFVNYYGCTFILYELSSPFLNFHWFFDKLGMTGSKPQLYNGLALLFTFFCCRLCWGTYQSVRVYQDVWTSLHRTNLTPAAKLYDSALFNSTAAVVADQVGGGNNMMRFAKNEFCPLWLAMIYLGSNIVLNTLNFYWFGKMIDAVRKRFVTPKEKKEPPTVIQSEIGKVEIPVVDTQTKQRRRVAA